jgi:hypothetical protein
MVGWVSGSCGKQWMMVGGEDGKGERAMANLGSFSMVLAVVGGLRMIYDVHVPIIKR